MRQAVMLVMIVVTALGASADWPQIRGPQADGVGVDDGALSDRDAVAFDVVWSVPIGSGYSGVVVGGGRAVTMARDGERDVMLAFDAATGKRLWRVDVEPTYAGHDGSHDGPIATPVIAGDLVVGLGARGRMLAVRAASGEIVWETNLAEDHGAPEPFYGFCTSPILVDGVLAVMLGAEGAAVAGFDPATGEKLWAGGTTQVAYQTPSMVADGDRHLVLAAGMDKLLALDAADGTLVWEYEHGGNGGRGAASLTAVPVGDRRLFLAHKDDASTVVEWRPGDEAAEFETLWEDRSIRNSYNIAVQRDGWIYAFSSRFLTAVDATTGTAAWRSREPGDGFLSLVGDHLVVATKDGSLHLVEATPEAYREVAAVPLAVDQVWTFPAWADGAVFVRGLGGLARVDVVEGAARLLADDDEAELPPGSAFGRFLAEAHAADDPAAVVDRFMEAQSSFPIVEPGWVHFVYRGDANDVGIGGDPFGARQDRPMHRLQGTDFFWRSARLAPDGRVEYVFVPDFGAAVPDPRNDRPTVVSSVYGPDMEMPRGAPGLTMSWVAGPEWRPPTHLGEPDPSRLGTVESREIHVEGLDAPLALEAWLPPGYADGDERYPVLYVFGGSQAREAGRFDTMLANLSGSAMRPAIAVFVGIPVPDAGSAADLFAETVVPFVDETWRTIAERDARAVWGSSFGGFGAMVAAMKHPETVSRIGVQSLAMLDMMEAQLMPLVPEDGAAADLAVVMEWSGYELRNPHENWDMGDVNRRFAETLRARGFAVEAREVGESTGWTGWRNRADDVLPELVPPVGDGGG